MPAWGPLHFRMIDDKSRSIVEQFIVEQIDSVPHLEALLLLWKSRPKPWSVDQMANDLYLSHDDTVNILANLAQRGLISVASDNPGLYFCAPQSQETEKLFQDLDRIYRTELIRVSQMIHSKASAAVRDFARAFRFKKDRE
jgi:predicted ArsR family transcriptional regulator